MPYSAEISRANPTCLLFLVDQSSSMLEPFGAQPDKQKAEGVAQGIEGVKSVKDLLQVVPKPQRDAVDKTDDVVKDDVKKAFDADPVVKDSGISVASVNKGVVLLSGSAKTLDAHLRAVEVARKVPGVHRVSSEVTVEGTN